MMSFTQKTLSKNASYQNLSLQQSTGMMIWMNDHWDLRAGVSGFHFSNAFMVPRACFINSASA
jgi:hypothetical protein